MSDSIYAPPEADVSVDVADEPDFYVVAPRKFYLLAVLTFNLYFVYWFYRNWRRIKERNNEDIWPPARAIFYIFFTHALFKNIDLKIKSLGKTFSWNPGVTATLFVVLSIVSNVVDRVASSGTGEPITDYIGLLSAPILPIFLLSAQRAINFSCEDPTGSGNDKLTLANWAWMVFGGFWWLLVVFGIYASIFEPELLLE